jgi:hypothetical protein
MLKPCLACGDIWQRKEIVKEAAEKRWTNKAKGIKQLQNGIIFGIKYLTISHRGGSIPLNGGQIQ